MEHSQLIGARIKALRTGQKMTLKQFSQATGLSVGFLSQAERGLSSVAIDSLETIAAVLGVTLASFFAQPAPAGVADPVVRSTAHRYTQVGERIHQAVLSNQVQGFELLPRVFLLMPSDGGEEVEPEMYTHRGEEFLYVLEGVVTVLLGGGTHTLYPGDSIQIPSGQPHNWVNKTNQVTRLLYVNSPNPFGAQAGQPGNT